MNQNLLRRSDKLMLTRDDLLFIINNIIVNERGVALNEEQLLTASNLDSFSYAVFWLTLADEGINMQDKWIDSIDYSTLRVRDVIDKIFESKKNNGTY